jgi:hypothetical protein
VRSEHTQCPERHRAGIGARVLGQLQEKRGSERSLLPAGELLLNLLEGLREQVAEHGERQPGLRFGRSGCEDATLVCSETDALAPQRRLADPGFALQQQHTGACCVVEEVGDGGELFLSPEDLVWGHCWRTYFNGALC